MSRAINNRFDTFYLLKGEHFIILTSLEDVNSSSFSYSIPLNYGNQVPIFLNADGDFLSYRILNDNGKYNKVIQFKLPPIKKNQKIKIHFDYWVLIKKIDRQDIPKIYLPLPNEKIPDDVKQWLYPTKSVQSNNLLIRLTAYMLKGFSKDFFWFIKKVMIWNAFRKSFFTFIKRHIVSHPLLNKIFLPDRYWMNLEDALSTLIFGGLCVGQANLAAAIFRSMEIPSRILISDNTFYGKDFYLDAQHYFNEIYCPDFGWIQSQSGRLFIPQGTNVILRILQPEDENIAGNGIGGYGGSAPWFWISNKSVIIDKAEEYMEYKLPKSKKVGVPAARVWIERKLRVPSDISEEIMEITGEIWELFTKNMGRRHKEHIRNYFLKGLDLHKHSIHLLKEDKFSEYVDVMKKIKKYYQKTE